MRHAQAIITSCMRYTVTFDAFVFLNILKYACARVLLRMPDSKKGRITRKIQKSIALAGTLFFAEKRHHVNLRYVGIRSIPFSRQSARWPEPRAYIYTTFAHVCDALEAVP